MKNKFYAVITKCGHVGKDKYREVIFPINADSGKEAAEIARWIPRVKHHKKDAIIDVTEIDYIEYKALLEKNLNDPYLQCRNVQEQNKYCVDLYLEIKEMRPDRLEDDRNKRIDRVLYKQRKNKIIEHDINAYFKGLSYEMAYVA